MKLIDKKKLEEVLSSNWSKFIDYKSLLDITVNSIQLYAQNWSTIYSSQSKIKKIQITKMEIEKTNQIKIWVNFQIPLENKIAIGAIELLLDIQGNFELTNCVGNFYT